MRVTVNTLKFLAVCFVLILSFLVGSFSEFNPFYVFATIGGIAGISSYVQVVLLTAIVNASGTADDALRNLKKEASNE